MKRRRSIRVFILTVYGVIRSILVPNSRIIILTYHLANHNLVKKIIKTLTKNSAVEECDDKKTTLKNGSTMTAIYQHKNSIVRGKRHEMFIKGVNINYKRRC